MAVIPSADRRVCDHLQAPLQEAHHGQLPRTEGADVPEISRETGADARRERPREVRRLRAVLGGLSRPTRSTSRRRRTTARCRPVRATRRSTRSTRRAASSAATAKKPVPSARSSWARTTSSPCTARTISCGTRRTARARPTKPGARREGLGKGGRPAGTLRPFHCPCR